MSIQRLIAVAHKEFRHIVRDARTCFLVTIAPVFLLVNLSYVFTFDVTRVDIALYDLDYTPLSRQLVAHLTADGDISVVARVQRAEEADDLFARGRADVLVIIPHGFADAALDGRRAHIQCVVDGADAITAGQSINLLDSRMRAFIVGANSEAAGSTAGPINLEISNRAWYNETLASLTSMVPGMMAVILCMPALALALALTRERETGSFETLIVTPVRGAEYLLGKLLAYELGGLLSVVLAWLVATLWFHVPFRGSLGVFILLSADYLIASMGISLLISNFVHNQQTAMFLILTVFFVPSFFVAGLILPVANDPVSQAVASILPTTHFITISRGVFLKGLGAIELWKPALTLLGIGLGCQVASLALFEKKIG